MGGGFCRQVPIKEQQITWKDTIKTQQLPLLEKREEGNQYHQKNIQQHEVKEPQSRISEQSTGTSPPLQLPKENQTREVRRMQLESEDEVIPLHAIHHNVEKPDFRRASVNQIEAVFNPNIRQVEQPLDMPSYIQRQPYEEKNDCYMIELEKLPRKGRNMPEFWVYVGQWHEGYPHGIGKIYHHAFVYEGYLQYGIPHLKGRYMTENDIYEGEISMNIRHGFGRVVTRSNYYFEGQWKNNIREGLGFEIHKSGLVFEGMYGQNTVLKGTLYLPKGNAKKKLNVIDNREYIDLCKKYWKQYYDGQFLNRMFHGKGVYCWSDMRKYEGEWQKGKMHGFGKFIWPNGKVYEGQYEDGKKCGHGVFRGTDKQYHGTWLNGLPHGHGTITRGITTQSRVFYKGKMVNSTEDDNISMLSNCQEQFPQETPTSIHIFGC